MVNKINRVKPNEMPDQFRHFYFHMFMLLKKCNELNKADLV
jgi:hypothetical protein